MLNIEKQDENLLSWVTWLGEMPGSLAAKMQDLAPLLQRFFSYQANENVLGGPFLEAPVDEAFHAFSGKWGVTPKPFWPEGRPYALAITHDMDRLLSTVQRAKKEGRSPIRMLRTLIADVPTALQSSKWKENPFFNFDRILSLQRELGFRSALYVLFEKRRFRLALTKNEWQHVIGVYDPSWIKDELAVFHRAGNEIGIHGSFDSYCRDKLLGGEREKLQEWTGAEVAGVRNHYLQYDPILSASAQRLAGLSYDSTTGFNFSNGFRMGTCFPFLRQGVWELPFQLMDSALRYQFDTTAKRLRCIEDIQRTVKKVGGALVVNWHTHVLNAVTYPEEVELLSRIITQAKADGAWLARPVDIIRHWEARAALTTCEKNEAAVL